MNIKKRLKFANDPKFCFCLKYTALFIVMFFFCFLPFILGHKSFVQKDDGFNQNLPIFVYTGRYYRNLLMNIFVNHTIPIYDFSIGLGGDIFAELDGYGILDLFLIPFAMATPAKYAAFGYTLMCIAKMYVGGLGYYYYLRRKGYYEAPAIASSFFFVFSCFTFAYGIMFPIFLNVTLYFPFIVMGLDSVFIIVKKPGDKNERKIIALGIGAVFLQALMGFYFIYMEILFSVFYVIYKLFKENELNVADKVRICIYSITYFFIGIALSAFIFIPELKLFFASSRGGSLSIGVQSFISLYHGRNFWERFSSLGIGIWGIGLGICTIGIMSIIYLFTEKGECFLKLAVILTIAAYFNGATGSITNGFSYSIDRYIFMIYFVLGIIICHEIPKIRKINVKQIIIAVIFVLSVAYSHFLSNADWPDFVKKRCILYAIVSIGLIIILKLGLYYLNAEPHRIRFLTALYMISIVIVSFAYNGDKRIGGMEWNSMFLHFSDVSDMITYSNYGNAAYRLGNDNDESFERIDIGDTSRGASYFTGTNSTTVYLSMIEPAHYEFLTEYGVSSAAESSFILKKLDGRASMEMLLSVKEYMDGNNAEVTPNEYYLPMGVVFDSYISSERASKFGTLEKNAILSKTVVVDGDVNNVVPYNEESISGTVNEVPIEITYENMDVKEGSFSANDQSRILVGINELVDKQSEYYLCIHDFLSLSGPRDIDIADKTVKLQSTYVDANSDHNIYVKIPNAFLEEGVVPVVFSENGYYGYSGITVEKINMESFAAEHQKLSKHTLQNVKFDGKKMTGTIQLDAPGILFMSIPYSPKWKCYVDDNEVSIMRADTGFSAVELDEGKHDVKFEYYFFK